MGRFGLVVFAWEASKSHVRKIHSLLHCHPHMRLMSSAHCPTAAPASPSAPPVNIIELFFFFGGISQQWSQGRCTGVFGTPYYDILPSSVTSIKTFSCHEIANGSWVGCCSRLGVRTRSGPGADMRLRYMYQICELVKIMRQRLGAVLLQRK